MPVRPDAVLPTFPPAGHRSARDAHRSAHPHPPYAAPRTRPARGPTRKSHRARHPPTLEPIRAAGPGPTLEVTVSNEARTQTEDAYLALQSTSEFQTLRKKFRGFVFPMTAFFLAWYFLYVLLSMFAPEFMGQEVGAPGITVGLLFGLGQFVTTFAITFIYANWANRELDPLAESVGAMLDAPKEK